MDYLVTYIYIDDLVYIELSVSFQIIYLEFSSFAGFRAWIKSYWVFVWGISFKYFSLLLG